MHRYEELEKLYYKKLYLKIFFGLLVLVILIVGSILYFKYKQKKVKVNFKKIEKVKLHNIKKSKPKKEVKKVKNIKKEIKKEKKSLKNYELKFILPDINSIKEPENNISEKNESKIKKVNKKQIIKETPKIEIKESNINLNALINEYKNNPTYNLAITIAKIYLKKNNLKQAQIWALKANSLNPSQPDSWIIFADILIKQHKIKKAKEILNVYITSYGNNDIIEEKLRSLDGK